MQNDSLPVSVQLRLEEVCARFEAAWKAAGSAATAPRIEERLGAAAGPGRAALLRELLRLDVHYRRRYDENPDADYYAARCPADAQAIRALFAELSNAPRPPRQAAPAADSSRGTMRPGPAAETAADPNRTGPAETPARPEAAPSKYPAIPHYEILGELGRGGMGVVYKARQTALKRLAALKMILSGDYASPEALARFRREAEAIARLCHPHIVQVYEVGEYDGRPFFSLEYVDGGTLATKLRESLPGPKEAAALVEKLARAMHAVHQCSVVHRDLKPANVLLTADGTPKITDFGLAKKLDEDAGQTHSGAVMGTPSYMAPEQASGGTARATPLADVYALGAILYECLTGRPPFRAATVAQTLRQVIEEEPVPPRGLNAAVPRDLETVCLKCLCKEPAKRYATAEALADDLRRWLHGEAIQARPVGRFEKLGRWCRRHPAPATAAGIILATVVTAFGIVMQSRDQAVEAKDEAVKLAKANLDLANNNGKLADDNQEKARKNAELAKDNEGKARKNAELAENNGKLANQERELRQKVQRQSANAFLTEGLYSCERGDVGRGMLFLAHGLDLAHQTKAADLEQACRTQLALWRSRLPAVKMLLPHADEVLAVAFSPDGRRILTGGADKTAMLWDVATGQPLGEPLRPGGEGAGRDSKRFPVLPGTGRPGFVSPADDMLPGSRPAGRPKHAGEVVAVAFSPDGRTLAVGTGDPAYRGRSQLIDTRDWMSDVMPMIPGLRTDDAWRGRSGGAFQPSDLSALVRLGSRAPLLWDAATGKPLHPGPSGPSGELVWAVAFSPDGRTVVTGGGSFQKGPAMDIPGRGRIPRPGLGLTPGRGFGRSDPLEALSRPGLAYVWDVAKGESLGLLGHSNAVLAVAFSPDGRRILTGSVDQTAQLWDAGTRRPLGKRLVHDGPVVAVAFSPDGRTILTCSRRSTTPGAVQLWNADTGQALGRPLEHPRPVLAGAFSPDGRAVMTGSGDPASGKGEAQLWAVATGKPLGQPLPHPGPVHSVAWSPDGRWVVTGCADKVARVWEAIPAPAVVQVGHHENAIAYAPDGRRVLLGTSSKDGQRCEQVALGETASGKPVLPLLQKAGTPGLVAFSPDSRKVLFEKDGGLLLVDAADGRLTGKPLWPGGRDRSLEAVAVSPDGRTILAGTSQPYAKKGEATLWDARTGQLLRTFTYAARVLSVAFSPDGHTVATGSGMPATAQGEARLWDVETGRPLGALAHQGPVRVVLFSPDGRTLASASDDRTARLWDVASGKPRGATLAHNAPVRALAFSADGGLLLTGSDDQTAQLWNTTTGKRIGGSLAHRGSVRAVAISGDGRLLATGSDDQTAQLWEAGTSRSLEEPLAHQGPVVSVAFGSDGRTLLTRSMSTNDRGWRLVGGVKETWVGLAWKSTGRVWALPAPVEGDPNSVLLQAQVATGLELDTESRVRVLDAPAWRERRGRLGGRGDPAPPAAARREWHRREARAAEAAGEWFAAQWHLERLGEGEPASEELHARRGRAYALSNRWERAIAELTKALRPKDLRAELWYFRGLAHSGLNQDDKALADFSEAISAENTGVVFYKRPRRRDAWVFWFQRGQAYFRLGQTDKAIADLSLVITENPEHGPSWYRRGVAYAELGQLERAAADFAAALQRPNAPARAWCDVALARLQLGDASGYRECCARALQRFGVHWGEDPVLAANLAWTCSLTPGATADPERVVSLARMASNGRQNYLCQRAEGAALYRAGKFQEAIERFASAMQLREKPAPSAWLFLALAHQRLKHAEEAKKWLGKAREWVDQARRQKPGEGGDKNALSWHKLPWNERLALTLLQREAEALLNEAKED
jgi:WD40 repeat protein/tetratricopeptide (TPR) repeat protein/tRNA A-37 threonylcarbamoyl transferase component Bud32